MVISAKILRRKESMRAGGYKIAGDAKVIGRAIGEGDSPLRKAKGSDRG